LGSSAERPLTAGDRFALDGVLGRQKDSTARMWQVYMLTTRRGQKGDG
jgi:hypothetical protein